MIKLDICFCQFGNLIGNNVFLPYSIGCIISYVKPLLPKHNYRMLYIKENIDMIIKKIGKPDILAFSTYIWNHQYNCVVAKQMKEKYPDIKIIFGGHNIDGFRPDIFEEYPYIDIIVNGEGEHNFYQLLKMYEGEMASADYTYQKQGYACVVKNKNNTLDINNICSPYTTGIFDEILKDKYNFTASLESNRGCPYACAYCDWGSFKTSNKKMRKFCLNRVFDEIEWFGRNKIGFVFGCDSNFGLYSERDMSIIDKFIEVKKKYGYPEKFRVCYAKNSNKIIFDMNKKLNKYDLSKGATLSFQSLNTDTTKAIGRINLDITEFNKYVLMYSKENIPMYTEMIIGLPEETYESFKNGLDILLNNHQHGNIVIYYCQIYPNSKINDIEYKKKYGIKTSTVSMYPTHTILNDDLYEQEEIITSTNKLIKEQWIKTSMFSWIVQTFHCLGLTQLIAIHFKYIYNIDYKEFYSKLLKYMNGLHFGIMTIECSKVLEIFTKVSDSIDGFKYINKHMKEFNWPIEEGSFLFFIEYINAFYIDIYAFLYEEFSCIMNKHNTVINNIITINQFMITKYIDWDKKIKYDYDYISNFKEYFRTGVYKNIFYKENSNSYEIIIPQIKKFKSFEEYATNVVWYGRKGGNTLKSFDEIIMKG